MVRTVYDTEEQELARLHVRAKEIKIVNARKISTAALKADPGLWLEVRDLFLTKGHLKGVYPKITRPTRRPVKMKSRTF